MKRLRFPPQAEEASAQCRHAWMKGVNSERTRILMRQQTE